jgi:outer membrane immunogenic protein
MKLSLLAGVSLSAIALAGGVQAADLGPRPVYKAPALAPAAWNWTGFYVGANVGAAFSNGSVADDPSSFVPWLNGASFGNNGVGAIGGLQAGYNWQMTSLVLGIEADISASSLNHTNSNVAAPFGGGGPDAYNTKLSWLATVRGRVGWAMDRTLFYGTGGVAFANLKDTITDTWFPISASTNSSVTGWTAGGGIEYALRDHWTAKVEYLHIGFPDRTGLDVPSGYAFRFKDAIDIGRVGINYKF